MQHLKFALVVGAFVLIATPVQAAQVCEAEIQEVLEAIKAGGNAMNLPQTREEAVQTVRDYTKGNSCNLESVSEIKTFADKEVTLIQRLEKTKSGEQAPGKYKLSEEEIEYSLRGRRAELARLRLVLCAMEKKNAKNCKVSETAAASNGKPLAKTERASSDGPSAAPTATPKAASQDTPVTPAPAGPVSSTQTAERTLAALGALAGNSPQKALNLLTPALTAAIGRNPNIVKALAGLNALNANSIQEALAILKPLLTDAAKMNPSSAKALAGLNALTTDAPEDAVAVLITILAGSASKNPTVAKTLASLQALPANTATVDAEGGTADNGNPTYPKITADDLVACKPEISTLHQLQIIYLKDEVRAECASGKQNEMCEHRTEWLNDSSGKRDIDWFVEGNDSCSGSDYPCYGLGLYNDEEPNEGMIRDLSLDTYKLPTSFEGRSWGDYSFVVDHCIAKIWVAKMDGQQAPLERNAPTSTTPDGSPKSSSRGKVS
jgi:hypothetical protein